MTTENVKKTLHDKFMQIDASIRGKSMVKKSKQLIDNGVNNFGANASSITGSKKLANCREFKDVNNTKQAIYKFILSNTIPFGDYRLISPARFIKIKQDLDKLLVQFQNNVDSLVLSWKQIVLDDKSKLGTLYNPADYPSENELRSSFGSKVIYRPLPDFNQFTVNGLTNSDMQELAKTLDESVKDDINAFNADMLQKLIYGTNPDGNEKLGNGLLYAISRIATTDSFKQNTLDNVKEVAEIVTDLNALDNPIIQSFAQKIKSLFDRDASHLRDSAGARKQLTEEAKSELEKIEEELKKLAI